MGTHHMSAVDSAWLRMDSPGNLLVVNAIFWTAEPADFDEFRTVIGERMIDRFPRFRQHPGSSRIPMGRAEWVDDEDFDVARHYRYVTLDEPGDEATLQAYVSSQTGIPSAGRDVAAAESDATPTESSPTLGPIRVSPSTRTR